MDLPQGQVEKIQEQFVKVAKLLDGKTKDGVSQQEAHVRLTHEHNMHLVEVNVNFHHHTLVANGTNAELEPAIHQAIHKLETQAIKITKKWSDGKRVPKVNEANAGD